MNSFHSFHSSVTNRVIAAKDHASVQLNIGEVRREMLMVMPENARNNTAVRLL